MPGADALIWISVKPLLKLIITTSFGYFLTKADLFGGVAARGAGQVLLNIFLPALLFSKIVPGFTTENIGALGPLILVACIYQFYGFIIAWIVRKLFWVPHRFHNGILAAGMWSNWGDLPTAVIMSMTASAPFTKGDSDVAVAYLSAFILVFFITLFPLGGHALIARDYADGAMPADIDDEVPESALARMRRRWANLRDIIYTRRSDSSALPRGVPRRDNQSAEETDAEKGAYTQQYPTIKRISSGLSEPTTLNEGQFGAQLARATPTVTDFITTTVYQTHDCATNKDDSSPVPESESCHEPQPKPSRLRCVLYSVRAFIRSLASPPTISMTVAFTVALVPTLKALFITPPAGSSVHIPPAPDNLPPLNFIIDTATFIGGGSIPLGLICLGSALARLEVPKPFTRAPLGAIAMFSILKMVVGPVFGVLVVEGLTHHTSLIDPNDKVLRFVCIYFAGVPTATTQVYLTQIYSPDGSASHISAFLIPQYALMVVTMTALSAYALGVLF